MDNLDKTLPKDLQNVVTEMKGTKASQEGNTKSSVEQEDSSKDGLAGATVSKETSNSASTEQSRNEQEKQAMENAMSKADIQKVVAELLAEKDAQASLEQKFAAIEAEKSDLAQQLSEATEAKATLSDKLDVAEKAIADSTSQVDALEKQKEELETKASALEEELNGIKAEQVLASRTVELTEAGILLPEGDKRDKQLERVSAMSNEAFASYSEELAEVAAVSKATKTVTPEGEETKKTEASAEEDTVETPDKTVASTPAPADVSAGEAYHQALAAISGEVKTDEGMVNTYASM